MAFAPRFRMGPPPRSFAADAHDCIVVAIPPDRPNTSSWRAMRARWRAPLGIVAVVDTEQAGTRHARVARLSKSVAVLATVKGKSLRDGLRPPLTATARSVRRKIRSGRGDVAGRSNKEMTSHDGLDTNRPIQVLWRNLSVAPATA